MTTGFFLSEEKLKQLNDLLDERNPRWTRKGTKSTDQKQQFVSPEVFLCQAPNNASDDNGIDGMIPAGDDDYDHPGVANCVVCQIVPSVATGQDYDLVPIEDSVKQVFNYSTDPIAKASFFLAIKDKFGNWEAVPPADGLPRFFNDHFDVAPAYGCMGVVGVDSSSGETIPKCDRPGGEPGTGTGTAGDTPKEYLVNTDAEVPSLKVGCYQNDGEMVLVQYETGTPVLDEVWVPKVGQFKLVKGEVGAPWGVVVAGIYDATAKILMGRVVENESETFQYHNSSGEACPAYGVGQVTGVDGTSPDVVPKVGKPTLGHYDVARDFIVNSDAEVADDARGTYQNRPHVKALYYTSGTPAVGELWGPTDGQWYLSKGAVGEWCVLVSGIVDSTAKVLEGFVIRSPVAWGKIQGTVTNQSGATQLTVSVKSCNGAGTVDPSGADAFNVKTPIDTKRQTALAQDDIVGYVTDAYGEKTIVTDCWNHYMLVVSQERFWLCGLQIDNEGHVTGWHDGGWKVRGEGVAYP